MVDSKSKHLFVGDLTLFQDVSGEQTTGKTDTFLQK